LQNASALSKKNAAHQNNIQYFIQATHINEHIWTSFVIVICSSVGGRSNGQYSRLSRTSIRKKYTHNNGCGIIKN